MFEESIRAIFYQLFEGNLGRGHENCKLASYYYATQANRVQSTGHVKRSDKILP